MKTKHIHSIKEDDETITIKFGKNMDEEEKSNSKTVKEPPMETENKKEQEDIQSKDKGTKERFERVFSIDSKKKKHYDENKRTVDIAFSS